jgi:hypothetical protein
MDYGVSMARQKINNETLWSSRSLDANHGSHHRYDYDKFVSGSFLKLIDAVRGGNVLPFNFESEVKSLAEGIEFRHGFYRLVDLPPKFVEIPERFSGLL